MNKQYLNYLIELLDSDITEEEREKIQFVINILLG